MKKYEPREYRILLHKHGYLHVEYRETSSWWERLLWVRKEWYPMDMSYDGPRMLRTATKEGNPEEFARETEYNLEQVKDWVLRKAIIHKEKWEQDQIPANTVIADLGKLP